MATRLLEGSSSRLRAVLRNQSFAARRATSDSASLAFDGIVDDQDFPAAAGQGATH